MGTEQLLLAPRAGSFLTGELLTSRRAAAHAILAAQSFSRVQVTDLGSGEARVPFVGELSVLHFLFNSRDEGIGHEEFSIQITPRVIHSLDL